ncbi:uncharacterized protein LOC128682599 [Plodia interpunctella]|uniref:uncharacterized protein LOC128682599 n=1 Tax=Plodia interpunctella TaxID=58824 RepID=UPI002367D5E4|nr:uncharacterized protein LOC128682599 [Plodia interpunctella]
MAPTSSSLCAGCRQKIIGRHITCSSEVCRKIYDVTCAKADKITRAELDAWICPECRASRRKTGDSSTPVRAVTYEDSDSVTHRKKTTTRLETPEPTETTSVPGGIYQALYKEFKALRECFEEFKPEVYSRLDAINLALLENAKRLEVIESKQDTLERRQTDLDVKQQILEQRNQELEMTVKTLEVQMSSLMQKGLRKEVEIMGIQENTTEQPAHLGFVIAAKIGVTLDPSDIEEASRAGPRRSTADLKDKYISRPLVVRFAKTSVRDSFLKEARARRNLKSNDIVEGCPEQRVYVNERLTTENRHLFRAARERANACDFKFCWVKNGSIYIRKKEGSPAVRIQSQNDLLGLAGQTESTS